MTGGRRSLLLLAAAGLFWLGIGAARFGHAEGARGNPAARLPSGASASEHWEFTARFDSGHYLFVEFLITNIGLGDRNAAAAWHLVLPDGKTRRSSNGRREGNWRLSTDRLRMEVGSSVLDLHTPTYRLRVEKKSVRIDLRFRPDAAALWSEGLAPPGYALDLLAAAVPLEGTLWVKGMAQPATVRGTVAATHSWTDEAGSALVLRRLEFFSLRQDAPFYGIDILSPGGRHTCWVVMKQDGGRVEGAHDLTVSLEGELRTGRESGYPVPKAVHLKGQRLEGTWRVDHVLFRTDPFADLPGPFRFMVQLALDLRPRRLWAASPFTLTLRGRRAETAASEGPLHIHGTGVTAVTYLNPLPATRPEAVRGHTGDHAHRRREQLARRS